MAGCMPNFELDVSHHEGIAIAESNVGELVLPLGATFIGKVKLCTCYLLKLTQAGEEICVDVRFEHMRDAELLLFGNTKVHVHIPLGINDGDRAAGLAPDHVAGVR